jgi:hypothetical protein
LLQRQAPARAPSKKDRYTPAAGGATKNKIMQPVCLDYETFYAKPRTGFNDPVIRAFAPCGQIIHPSDFPFGILPLF